MNTKQTRLPVSLLLMGLSLCVLVGTLVGLSLVVAAGSLEHSRVGAALAASSPQSLLYLPAVFHNFPLHPIFGIESNSITGDDLAQLLELDPVFVRRNGLLWANVAPDRNTRNWPANLEADLVNASASGMEVILIVRRTPTWAQAIGGSYCGPIMEAEFPAFAQFMSEAVARYSQPPYNVRYYEIWNEPDIGVHAGDDIFGCWGDPNEPYYGGEYYGELLKAVYPQVKAANPLAQVLLGGLVLDCDPNTLAACDDPKPLQFLEGVLRNNAGACTGGACFDGVSFHAYDYYGGGLGMFSNTNWLTSWDTSGPVVAAKAQFIAGLLAEYHVQSKYLMNTESAMLKVISPCDATCQDTKAYYISQVYAMATVEGLRANVWYSLTGWRESGLYDPDSGAQLPAGKAFSAARSILGQVVFLDQVTGYAGVAGYQFRHAGGPVWLVWSQDGAPHAITLPGVPQKIWDVFGAEQSIGGTALTVTIAPQYIQFYP